MIVLLVTKTCPGNDRGGLIIKYSRLKNARSYSKKAYFSTALNILSKIDKLLTN